MTKDLHHQAESGSYADLLDGAVWRTSSYSGTAGNCVEVATNLPGIVAVRDSNDPDGPRLVVSPAAWRAFVDSLKAGESGR